VRVTSVPWSYSAEQVDPQEMPTGWLVTVPVPVPCFSTVSLRLIRLKVALTVLAPDIVALHLFSIVTESQPDHLTAAELAPAMPLSRTAVLSAKAKEQVVPQLIPAGELVTVPVPVPSFSSVRVWEA